MRRYYLKSGLWMSVLTLMIFGGLYVAADLNATDRPSNALNIDGGFWSDTGAGFASGKISGRSTKIALGPNANATVTIDLITDGGAGNQMDDGVHSGNVSGQGTKIAVEVFAKGVTTSLRGMVIKFDFDTSVLTFVKAENSAFGLLLPESDKTGTNFAATPPVTLGPAGFLARAEFSTVVDVTNKEFTLGITSVTLAESSASSDIITTTDAIAFNANVASSPAASSSDFDGDGMVGTADFLLFAYHFGSSLGDGTYQAKYDLDGNGVIGLSDVLIFVNNFGSQVPSSGGDGGGGSSGSPDLIVESPSVSDNTLTTGQSFTLSATVRNQGTGASASTTLRYYQSSNATISTSDTEVGTDSVNGLSASGTSADSISLNAPSSAGTYYYGACVESVSGESNTDNNCSSAVRVTVSQTTSGFAPADQQAFNSLVVGKRIRAETYFVDFESADRFTESLGRDSGSYTYSNTGANTGTLTQNYDAGLYGGRCTTQLTFTATTTGTLRFTCDNGIASEEERWQLSSLTTPVFAKTNADTLFFAFLDTWSAGQTRAYDFQVRKKMPQGSWQDLCLSSPNSSQNLVTTYVIAYFTGTESNTTYEMRYRYRNSSSCNTGSPGPWSAIVEGTTPETGSGSGSGGNTYGVGESLPNFPSGFFVPRRASSASFSYSGGQAVLSFNNGGVIELQDGTTYTCIASDGCSVEGGRVTAGTIRVTTGSSSGGGGGGSGGGGSSGSPDLVVESPSVSDNTLTTGQSFTLSATVRNQGTGSSATTTLRYYRSSDATISTGDTSVGTDSVSGLSASGTSAESISLNAPSSAGTYYYGACVESVSGESSTDNNCSDGVSVTVSSSSTGSSGRWKPW